MGMPIGHLFRQFLATLTACTSILLSGLWLGWVSVFLPKIYSNETGLAFSESDITWIVALMDFGNLLSPIPSGYIMDRFGRLNALRLAGISFILASSFAMTATSPYYLYAARLFAGVGKGIGFTVAPMYIAEIAGPTIRGALTGIFVITLIGGSACAMTFGPFFPIEYLNWITMVLAVAVLVLSVVIEESPYYFFMRGDGDAGRRAFEWFRNKDAKECNEIEMANILRKVEEDMSHETSFSELFSSRSNRRALTIVMVTCALQRLGGISCILAYASTTLPRTEFWDPKITLMVFGWFSAGAGFMSLFLIDCAGRKPLLLISTVGLAVISALSSGYYFMYRRYYVEALNFAFIPHVGVMLFGWFYGIGIGQIPHTFQSELFPTNVKSHASALATIVLSVCSFSINKYYLPVGSMYGAWIMYALFYASNAIAVIFTMCCVFETKRKTLAEIQSILKKE